MASRPLLLLAALAITSAACARHEARHAIAEMRDSQRRLEREGQLLSISQSPYYAGHSVPFTGKTSAGARAFIDNREVEVSRGGEFTFRVRVPSAGERSVHILVRLPNGEMIGRWQTVTAPPAVAAF